MKIDLHPKRIIKNLLIYSLRKTGYSTYFSPIVFKKRYEDIFRNRHTTLFQKIWAQKRGFLSNKISFYGLTEENYRDYLTDFDYFRLHPINGPFSMWIDDKLTMKYILQPFKESLPEYYYHLYHHEIIRLSECPECYDQTIPGILDLLKAKQILAAKMGRGTLGKGFYKISCSGNKYFINNKPTTRDRIIELMSHWLDSMGSDHIITEYLQAHRDLLKIWPDSPNSIRLMVIREVNKNPEIVTAFIRFGVKSTGVLEDPAGVRCLVDLDTGHFSDAKIHTDFAMVESKYHPDSGVLVEGVVPCWKQVKEKILEVSSYIPQVRYMGFDVIITDDGFKIIEINSHQGIELIQYYKPLLSDGVASGFFKHLLKEKELGSG